MRIRLDLRENLGMHSSGHQRKNWSYPALRSLLSEASGRLLSSSHSNDNAREVVSMGSSSGMSSATDAPKSANLRAETSTRFSSEPTAWLYASTGRSRLPPT